MSLTVDITTGLLDLTERAINEHGSATIMRERLDLIRDQAQALEKKIAEFQTENTALKKRVADLEAQVATKTARDEFVECRGAFLSGSRQAVITMRYSAPIVVAR